MSSLRQCGQKPLKPSKPNQSKSAREGKVDQVRISNSTFTGVTLCFLDERL